MGRLLRTRSRISVEEAATTSIATTWILGCSGAGLNPKPASTGASWWVLGWSAPLQVVCAHLCHLATAERHSNGKGVRACGSRTAQQHWILKLAEIGAGTPKNQATPNPPFRCLVFP